MDKKMKKYYGVLVKYVGAHGDDVIDVPSVKLSRESAKEDALEIQEEEQENKGIDGYPFRVKEISVVLIKQLETLEI